MKFFEGLLDLLYPSACAVCGGDVAGRQSICDVCMAAVPLRDMSTCCSVCGKTLLTFEQAQNTTATLLCSRCRSKRPSFDAARSAAVYSGSVRTMIHLLKYHGGYRAADDLSGLLHAAFLAYYANEAVDAIVPLPLHSRKYRRRGYNQAERLARSLSEKTGLPMDPKLLWRSKDTATQTKKSALERRKNMEDAFDVPASAATRAYGKCLLLVDDVMTTGATFEDASRALRAAGAARILCLSVARD